MRNKYNVRRLIIPTVWGFDWNFDQPNDLLSLQIYRPPDKPTQQAYRKFVKQIYNDSNKNHIDRFNGGFAAAMQLLPIQFTHN